MFRTPLGFAAIVMLSSPAWAQSPTFEVASLKSAVDPGHVPIFCLVPCVPGERLNIEGSRLDIRFMSLSRLILAAYRIKAYQLSGPEWMSSERFDIMARLPAGVSKDQVPELLQSLLAERFKLTLHHEKKELAVYALVVGKGGLKIKESSEEADVPVPDVPGSRELYTSQGQARMSDNGHVVVTGGPLGPLQSNRTPDGTNRIELSKVTMPGLVELVTSHMDLPVIDGTGLTGAYSMQIAIEAPPPAEGGGRKDGSPPPAGAAPPADIFGESILKAIEKAGLKLESRKAPVEMLVVDRLEKTPTGN